MKLLTLELNNFISYKNEQIDLKDVKLASVIGENGSGKSSLLESITYVLFGNTRAKTDDELLRLGENMNIKLAFEIDGKTVLVSRTKKLGKTSKLLLSEDGNDISGNSVSETQDKIEKILNANYDTFVNSAFILQNKFDEFIKKTSAQKNEIFMSFLDIERYGDYEEVAKENAKRIETDIQYSVSRIETLESSLSNIGDLTEQKSECENHIKKLEVEIKDVEKILSEVTKRESDYESFQKNYDQMVRLKESLTIDLNQIKYKLKTETTTLALTPEEQKNAVQWEEWAKLDLAGLIAGEQTIMDTNKADGLVFKTKRDESENKKNQVPKFKGNFTDETWENVKGLDLSVKIKESESDIDKFNQECITCKVQREGLESKKKDMVAIDGKNGKCWVCGHEIPKEQLVEMIAGLDKEINALTEKWNESRQSYDRSVALRDQYLDAVNYKLIMVYNKEIEDFNSKYLECKAKYKGAEERQTGWNRVVVYTKVKDFEKQVADKEKQLSELNIKDDDIEVKQKEVEVIKKEKRDYEGRKNELRSTIDGFKIKLGSLIKQEESNQETHKELKALKNSIDGAKIDMGHYKELTRAFSKKGISALIIDNSIPLIETESNRLLEKLNSSLRIKFERKPDKNESLELYVEDNAGIRNISMFSGGETIRVALAIRIALSRLLMLRSNAKIDVLVIDEPSGLDESGLECLVQSLKVLSDEYQQIFVISHIESLVSAFNQTLIVTKDDIEGSKVFIKGV